MERLQSLNHTKWDCKYHVVWIPKYRKKALYGELRRDLGAVLQGVGETEGERDSRRAADGRSCSHVDLDSTEICGAQVIGYMKGKSAIRMARTYGAEKEF